MSLITIQEQIQKFLSSEEPEVLAIKGAWGVGKTYTWNKLLLSAKDDQKISLNKYSYVSVFGINSLDSFKYSIFENSVNKDLIGTEPSLESFKNNSFSLMSSLGRKTAQFLKNAPLVKSASPALESLSFLYLSKMIICIDDIERKGNGVEARDVLGLISLLKEQKKCKIVLLLNDSDEKNLEDYAEFKEKVIDKELEFSPTTQECTTIAISKQCFEYDYLLECIHKLSIRNIRIIKKIERLVGELGELSEQFENKVRRQVVHSVALFISCYYRQKSCTTLPTIEFLTSGSFRYLGIKDEELTEEQKSWNLTLRDYDFGAVDELDKVLINAVISGFINVEKFNKTAEILNEQAKAEMLENTFNTAWELYHHSFDDNQDEVIAKVYEGAKENILNVSPLNLNGTVMLLKGLGENAKATELVDLYTENRKSESKLFDMRENLIFGDKFDEELVAKFETAYTNSFEVEPIGEILKRMARNSCWSENDIQTLSNASINDFYQLFKEEKGKELSSIVATSLKYGAVENAKSALIKIGNESDINKRRVRKFGIEL